MLMSSAFSNTENITELSKQFLGGGGWQKLHSSRREAMETVGLDDSCLGPAVLPSPGSLMKCSILPSLQTW